ncbi:unnamed protein product [Sphagnum jensenii]|uniref:Uncharacterized protein n=1 Tax=Sphagnum jensenii TaxID=128206 RepID=A0ABP1ASC6_9BRYO
MGGMGGSGSSSNGPHDRLWEYFSSPRARPAFPVRASTDVAFRVPHGTIAHGKMASREASPGGIHSGG